MSTTTHRLLLLLLAEHRSSLAIARRLAAAQLGAGHPLVGQYQAQLRAAGDAEEELRAEREIAA
jgi:hypothetical protein